ncbi:helix-turn-helix transcriptional regulator [Aquincola tertiaricarbonis]|uniref:helix-turn-helix transcriptional regulator n=1 Tax=Aquincola tertiaricarbonis TaxID=391953 RepID=UPI00061525E2|nr:YafY family protein [Aquincola tertiaricarbonis]
MRKADRLLQIVQVLRRRGRATTARRLAEELEVATRTIYRDIAALQSSGVPVDGEAGIGYVLRPGYDLPPLMFSTEELEAVVLGARMVMERSDTLLSSAAENALAKIRTVIPKAEQDRLWQSSLLVPHRLEEAVAFGPHVPRLREAIRHAHKIRIDYQDLQDRRSTRVVWPLGLYLFSHVTLVCCWCELRGDFRAFRSERIRRCDRLDDHFDPRNGALLTEFLATFRVP